MGGGRLSEKEEVLDEGGTELVSGTRACGQQVTLKFRDCHVCDFGGWIALLNKKGGRGLVLIRDVFLLG